MTDADWIAEGEEAMREPTIEYDGGQELAIRPAQTPAPMTGLFGTDQPELVIERATRVADVLKAVLDKQGLVSKINGREYIRAEGWTTLGAMVGVFPKVEWTRPIVGVDGEQLGWESAVVVVNSQGVEIGRAEAECLRSERNWAGRDDYALRSMAQTRCMGKALRMPLGFIAVLAGYEATPAEEMPTEPKRPAAVVEDWLEIEEEMGLVGEVDVLAAKVGDDEHKKTLDAIAKHRAKFDGRVSRAWLLKLKTALEKKLPEESPFKAPAGAT